MFHGLLMRFTFLWCCVLIGRSSGVEWQENKATLDDLHRLCFWRSCMVFHGYKCKKLCQTSLEANIPWLHLHTATNTCTHSHTCTHFLSHTHTQHLWSQGMVVLFQVWDMWMWEQKNMRDRGGLLFVSSHFGWKDSYGHPCLPVALLYQSRTGEVKIRGSSGSPRIAVIISEITDGHLSTTEMQQPSRVPSLTMIAASWLLLYYDPNVLSAVKNNRIKRYTRWMKQQWLYL